MTHFATSRQCQWVHITLNLNSLKWELPLELSRMGSPAFSKQAQCGRQIIDASLSAGAHLNQYHHHVSSALSINGASLPGYCPLLIQSGAVSVCEWKMWVPVEVFSSGDCCFLVEPDTSAKDETSPRSSKAQNQGCRWSSSPPPLL
jgi:hypothetical protein